MPRQRPRCGTRTRRQGPASGRRPPRRRLAGCRLGSRRRIGDRGRAWAPALSGPPEPPASDLPEPLAAAVGAPSAQKSAPPSPSPSPRAATGPTPEPGSGLLGTKYHRRAGALRPARRGHAGPVPAPAEGKVWRVQIAVEKGLPVDPEVFAEAVLATLNDPRGWNAADGSTFAWTDSDSYDARVVLASPGTTDELCLPLDTIGELSCGIEETAVLNFKRWATGSQAWKDIGDYRQYLVNHEVGHVIGYHHDLCAGEGEHATIMVQQTTTTSGCIPEPWPPAPIRGRATNTFRRTKPGIRRQPRAGRRGVSVARGSIVRVTPTLALAPRLTPPGDPSRRGRTCAGRGRCAARRHPDGCRRGRAEQPGDAGPRCARLGQDHRHLRGRRAGARLGRTAGACPRPRVVPARRGSAARRGSGPGRTHGRRADGSHRVVRRVRGAPQACRRARAAHADPGLGPGAGPGAGRAARRTRRGRGAAARAAGRPARGVARPAWAAPGAA